jgi:hypothetical protein
LAKDLLKHLLLYRELKAEHDEILRHKWLESEKVGYDVGFDLAMIDWTLKHSSQWHRERQDKRIALRPDWGGGAGDGNRTHVVNPQLHCQ